MRHKSILVLDFGSQYTQLIARRLRELGVYCEIHPYDFSLSQFAALDPCGIILSGGPASITAAENPSAPEWIFHSGVPLLGICYGMQTMAAQLGGLVTSSDFREFGYAELMMEAECELLKDVYERHHEKGYGLLDVWMSHGDQVSILPPDFEVICTTRNTAIAGMAHHAKRWYGLQFHPEVTHTPQGLTILRRFALDICKADANWTPDHIIDETIATIRQKVGSEKVLLGLSGGVDSSVAAALLHRAIGDQLICVFVDTGLLRLHEANQVKLMFKDYTDMTIIWVDAADAFMTALQGLTCPEEKRKTIGRVFIEIFQQEARALPEVKWLAQGTIYSDVIESAATNKRGVSEVIKSHHNVGGLPDTLKLKLIEPLRELFKDEVRRMGLELGLPKHVIQRHPFPGPGLGVRILGEITLEYAAMLRHADAIFMEELQSSGLYHQVSQAFAVFLPVKSVGVMGDGRQYGYVIALRAVETVDFMTAHWSHLPWDFLAIVSNRIINEVKGISRVTYDISGKPPATIEWE